MDLLCDPVCPGVHSLFSVYLGWARTLESPKYEIISAHRLPGLKLSYSFGIVSRDSHTLGECSATGIYTAPLLTIFIE